MVRDTLSGLSLVMGTLSGVSSVRDTLSGVSLVKDSLSGVSLVGDSLSGLMVRDTLSGVSLVREGHAIRGHWWSGKHCQGCHWSCYGSVDKGLLSEVSRTHCQVFQ